MSATRYGGGSSILRFGSIKVFRGGKFDPTLRLRCEPGTPGYDKRRPPKLRGWKCTFVGFVGGEHVTYSYRRARAG